MRLLSKSGSLISPDEHGISIRALTALKHDQISVQSQQTLKLLHNKYWLACDCTNHDCNEAALTVRSNPNGGYSLVNISGRGEHNPSCNLSYEKLNNQTRNKKIASFDFSDPADKRSLCLMANMLIERSKLHVLSDYSTYKCNKTSIMSVGINQISITGRPLADLFNFGFRSFFTLRDNPSIEGDFICEVVDEIKEANGTVELKDTHTGKTIFSLFRSITDIFIKPDPEPSKSGAYLVLAYLGKNRRSKDKSTISPISAIILPIVSKHIWNITSHSHHRQVVQCLLNAKAWYREKQNKEITIIMPTSPLKTDAGTCMPDFLISYNNNTHLLNLLPADLDVETDNPLKSIDLLREYAPITEIPFEFEGKANDYFFKVIKKLLGALQHKV
jgi:hypothetical protein